MQLKDFIKIEWNVGVLKIKVVPNSRTTEVLWLMNDWVLKIRLKSLPEKNKANKELISFISRELWLRKTSVNIIWWHTSVNKTLSIDFG